MQCISNLCRKHMSAAIIFGDTLCRDLPRSLRTNIVHGGGPNFYLKTGRLAQLLLREESDHVYDMHQPGAPAMSRKRRAWPFPIMLSLWSAHVVQVEYMRRYEVHPIDDRGRRKETVLHVFTNLHDGRIVWKSYLDNNLDNGCCRCASIVDYSIGTSRTAGGACFSVCGASRLRSSHY